LELVFWLVIPSSAVWLGITPISLILHVSDAADVYSSTFFADSDPISGLGGWGDPSHDFEVPSGGLSNFHLSYPSAHTLRRNFTLRPYLNIDSAFFPDPELMANTSFTKAEVTKMVGGFEGNFKGFQKYFEGFTVCLDSSTGCSHRLYIANP
jgi:hypothetical protein